MNEGRCPGRQMPFPIPAGAVLLTTIFLLWGTGTSPARDEEPPLAGEEELSAEEQAAVIQYLARFRFGPDLKVGDWVRYSYLTITGLIYCGRSIAIN
ncbi:MAG: hypothetical protein JXQ83_13525 [Candidatus Glassbacteria bacterium]|nr:hypothetical protein [Candidatus Glassbacteria bacterium]